MRGLTLAKLPVFPLDPDQLPARERDILPLWLMEVAERVNARTGASAAEPERPETADLTPEHSADITSRIRQAVLDQQAKDAARHE